MYQRVKQKIIYQEGSEIRGISYSEGGVKKGCHVLQLSVSRSHYSLCE